MQSSSQVLKSAQIQSKQSMLGLQRPNVFSSGTIQFIILLVDPERRAISVSKQQSDSNGRLQRSLQRQDLHFNYLNLLSKSREICQNILRQSSREEHKESPYRGRESETLKQTPASKFSEGSSPKSHSKKEAH